MQHMQVKVKNSKGQTFQIPVQPTDKVITLKEQAAQRFGSSDVQNIKLIFRGKLLVDDNTLESYEIKEDSLIMFLSQNKSAQQLQDEKDFEAHKPVVSVSTDGARNGGTGLLSSGVFGSPPCHQLEHGSGSR